MAIAKMRGLSPELEQIQSRTDDGIARSVPSWVQDGNELPELDLVPGVTKIVHGLGRALAGWVFLRIRSGATLVAPITEIACDQNTLSLVNTNSGVTVKVKLWVF